MGIVKSYGSFLINHIPYFSGDTFGDTFENTSIHKARFIILWKSDVSRSIGIVVCVKGVRINLGFLLSPTAPDLPLDNQHIIL